MPARKILIFGHYGLPNWGDEAILAGLLRRLNPQKWKVQVVSPFPEFVRKQHGIKALVPPPAGLRSFFRGLFQGTLGKSLQPLREADFIIFGGGGLFQEYPKKALKIWNRYLRLCRSLDKKILLVGNSIGPFRSLRSLRSTGKLFRSVSFFSVRDEASVELLLKMGIPEQKIHLATDAAFLLPKIPAHPGKEELLLISLRAADTSTKDLSLLREYVAFLRRKGRKIEFLSMQSRQENDDILAAKLDLPLFPPKNLGELRKKIARSTLLISSRLHPCILAMLSGTPFLALPMRPKIAAFLESSGLKELLAANVTLDELKKRTESTLKNKKVVQRKILAATQKEKEKTAFLLPDFF